MASRRRPEQRPLQFCLYLAQGVGGGGWGAAHLLEEAGPALQVLQSTLHISHALLQRTNCPHQPCVQFLGPQRAALCRAQTHREGDSGGNSARDRVVAGWGRSGEKSSGSAVPCTTCDFSKVHPCG